ncbi:hypothetical protein G7Y89_g7665 [Cudoniella acicularis]|uniref:Apple domain-containing protein n=1 Tax=Cudoniella acicularis TaxID=354080 RepID=A0A8H4RLL6_9HELO|nr:hypothetical protein G7Y89_g7665 [Cudoniella acicularis]
MRLKATYALLGLLSLTIAQEIAQEFLAYDFIDTQAAIQATAMNKTQADAICASDPFYGPNYEAVMKDGVPVGCVCKPSVCPQPCFGNPYIDPKTGGRGCCSLDQKYSYDNTSLTGACCGNGTSYAYDPVAGVGGCCNGPTPGFYPPTYSCSCGAPKPLPPDECTKPFPKSVQNGGKNYLTYTGRATYATNIPGGGDAKTFNQCLAACSATSNCVALDFITDLKQCYLKSDGNDKVPSRQQNNVDSAIIPACLTKNDKCPALNQTIKVYGGQGYTFYCGRVLGTGNVKPTYTTPDLFTCVSDCSKTPGCQGVNYPAAGGAGACNLKSNYESPPKTVNAYYVAAVVLKQRVGGSSVESEL